tara:strand:+ start:219 stop:497 length:279 start_codon:yes stop_codon:yes gene_type:complete
MLETIQNLSESPKIATGVTLATGSTAVAHAFDLAANALGMAATVAAITLSLVLIYTHLRKAKADSIKSEIEIEILEGQRRAQKAKNKSSIKE